MNKYIYILFFLYLSQTFSAQISEAHVLDLIQSKQYSKLETQLVNHVKQFAQDDQMLEYLGDVYGFQSKWSNAAECYQRLAAAHPKNANYHYKYGGVLGRMAKEGSKLKALKLIRQTKALFKTAEQLDPYHLPVQWAQVQLYAELPGFLGGSYQTAWGHAEQLQQLSKIEGYMAKVYILEKQDRTQIAKQYAQKIVKYHNQFPCLNIIQKVEKDCEDFDNNLYFGVANAYTLTQGDLSVVELFLKSYISKYTTRDRTPIEIAYLKLSEVYIEKNQKDLALDCLNAALLIDSNFEAAMQAKQQILSANRANDSY